MWAAGLELRGFRNLVDSEPGLAAGINVVHGPNGAGKTNLLEALYFGLAGRSLRSGRTREAIRFGADLARVEVSVLEAEPATRGPDAGAGPAATFMASVSRDGERRHLVDGKALPPGAAAARRPPLAVFMPDRLALIKGPPGGRRVHLDRFVAALWPSRGDLRRRYGRVLAQRNALIGRIRGGAVASSALDPWDRELARETAELRAARAEAVALIASAFADAAGSLGLDGAAAMRYVARAPTGDADDLVAALAERREGDLARGFTVAGAHRDELEVELDGRSLRRYGSQGQQRVALLALLLAERQGLIDAGRPPPLLLLDDVMSELDPSRRTMLAELLAGTGQALVTATEAGAFPGAPDLELRVERGVVEAATVPA